MTEVHVRAHRQARHVGLWAILQEIGIVQAPRHHWRHHRGEMNSHYCILTGWLNPILDTLRVWEWLERALAAVEEDPSTGSGLVEGEK